MRIIGVEKIPDAGVPLGKVAYGTVVRIARSPALYLVISMMDGTGIKRLVTLGGGSLKDFPEDQPVQPIDATLHVHGVITPDSLGWNEAVPPWYEWPRKQMCDCGKA